MKKLLPEQEPDPRRAQPAKETGKSYATETQTQTQTEALAKKSYGKLARRWHNFRRVACQVYMCVCTVCHILCTHVCLPANVFLVLRDELCALLSLVSAPLSVSFLLCFPFSSIRYLCPSSVTFCDFFCTFPFHSLRNAGSNFEVMQLIWVYFSSFC